MQTSCVLALQPAPKVFWLVAAANHLCGCTTACPQGVLARSACKPLMWWHYSLFPRCFGLKAHAIHLRGCATACFSGVLAKSSRKSSFWAHYTCPQGVLAKSACRPPVWLQYSLAPRAFYYRRMQATCTVALQPAPKVFWLKAPASRLRGCIAACLQGALG